MTPRKVLTLVSVLVMGIVLGRISSPRRASAEAGVYWNKSQVIPVVVVKPVIGGFAPVNGTSIGNTWPKDDVTPMCLVKPGIGGFSPTIGSSIGNTWMKEEVKPIVVVQPAGSVWTPSERSCF
jgi:hypothetical protein